MTANPANNLFHALNRSRPTHWVSLHSWMDLKYRAEIAEWAKQHGYEIGINTDDLGPMNSYSPRHQRREEITEYEGEANSPDRTLIGD